MVPGGDRDGYDFNLLMRLQHRLQAGMRGDLVFGSFGFRRFGFYIGNGHQPPGKKPRGQGGEVLLTHATTPQKTKIERTHFR